MMSRLRRLAVLATILMVASACSGAPKPSAEHTATKRSPAPARSPVPGPTGTGRVPHYDHIFWVMEENQNYNSIVGSPNAPYLNATLIPQGSIATNTSALTHPSVNNYLGDISGQLYNRVPPAIGSPVTDTCRPTQTSCSTGAWNLFDGLQSAGKTWATYEEDMPSACYTSYQAGNYVERHNPAPYFNQIRDNPARCADDKPYTDLATDLRSTATTPTFSFITPNLQNDMHDGTVNQADGWLKHNLPAVFNSSAWKAQHCLLIVTEDENDGAGGNIVPLIFVSSDGSVPAGHRDGTAYTQYDTLRTIEDSVGVTPGGPGDESARDETGMFR